MAKVRTNGESKPGSQELEAWVAAWKEVSELLQQLQDYETDEDDDGWRL